MSKKATEFQRKAMSRMYRGKEIFKPLNTGWIDENVACVREWVANIFFYRKGDIFIDPAGVQRLKDLFAPVHPAHCFSLKLRCLFRHDHTSFLCCDAKPALFIFVALDLTKSCLLQIRFTVHNAMLFTRCAHCSG